MLSVSKVHEGTRGVPGRSCQMAEESKSPKDGKEVEEPIKENEKSGQKENLDKVVSQ